MEPASEKELPPIPPPTLRPLSSPIPKVLHVDAREHRGRLIRHFISELVPLPSSTEHTDEEAGIEAWAAAIECSLDELGQCIVRGDWLSGVLKRRRKLAQRSQSEEESEHSKQSSSANQTSPIVTLRGLASFSQPSDLSRRDPKHIVLCLAPAADDRRNSIILPKEDLGFDIISDVVRRPLCSFRVGTYVLPNDAADENQEESQGCILYGLREWEEWCDAFPALPLPLLAGGTFTIQNAISTAQRQAVASVLRLAIYVHLSLVLEQDLLQDLGVKLDHTPPPERTPIPLPNSAPVPEQPSLHRTVSANIRQGLFSFLGSRPLRRFGSLTSRVDGSMAPPLSVPLITGGLEQARSGGSLDLSRVSSLKLGYRHADREPSTSTDGTITPTSSRLRRFSLRGSVERPAYLSGSGRVVNQGNQSHHVSMMILLEKLNKEKELLSSSPGVSIPPPPLIISLAAKEKFDVGNTSSQPKTGSARTGPKRRKRLKAEERVGLNSLLGWDARHEPGLNVDRGHGPTGTLKVPVNMTLRKGQGMTGVGGFVRQQGIEVVLSRHVPGSLDENTSKRTSISSKSGSAEDAEGGRNDLGESKAIAYTPCGRSIALNFRYYGEVEEEEVVKEGENDVEFEDRPLGDVILALIEEASQDCMGRCGVLELRRNDGSFISRRRKRRRKPNLEMSESSTGTIRSTATAETSTTAASTSTAASSIVVEEDLKSVAAATAAKEKKLKREKEKHKCTAKQGMHEIRIIHGETCVCITVEGFDTSDADKQYKDVSIWSSCAVCAAVLGEKRPLSDGASLSSFAKFLELLIYSSAFDKVDGELCEHMSSSPLKNYNILRHFSVQTSPTHPSRTVTFRLSQISDKVYDLRVPQLQVDSTNAGTKWDPSLAKANAVLGIGKGEEKKILRKEIKTWWERMSDHLDVLENILPPPEDNLQIPGWRKALPRIPSVDDSWDENVIPPDTSAPPEPSSTDIPLPPIDAVNGLPTSRPSSPHRFHGYFEKLKAHSPLAFASSGDYFPIMKPRTPAKDTPLPTQPPSLVLHAPKPQRITSAPAPIAAIQSESSTDTVQPSGSVTPKPHPNTMEDTPKLLSALRETFQRTEQNLYTQLSKATENNLNDVRRAFWSAAKGAEKRLAIWQSKHLPSKTPPRPLLTEPEWFASGCHALPGGNIIVREDDWGSIIAYTLSTPDYQRELFGMAIPRVSSASALSPLNLSSPHDTSPNEGPTSSTSSFFSSASQRFFSFGSEAQPDPDREDIVWHEPEAYSAVVSRKEHPRDPSSLLSIREVLRQKSPTEISALTMNSRFSRSSSHLPPPSAWSKPEVQVSMEAADGQVNGLPGLSDGSAGKKLQEIEAVTDPISRPSSSLSGILHNSVSSASSLGFEAHIVKRKTSSILSSSIDTEKPEDEDLRVSIPSCPTTPNDLEKKEGLAKPSPSPQQSSGSILTNTLTTGFTNAMRFVLTGTNDQDRNASSLHHHGLLSADSLNVDERPHIKYDWTVGKRLKFSCTVYYAKQFDSLRKRCGIDDIFLKSISSSNNWAAEGGKSKSNFWKTSDDRFIIKTLVNAWNVADLQVLIEFGPSYFKYLESTASKPSVLAKLMGFYTIEIRNMETGAIQAKNDLLIMENLFYQQQITKTFDLKGIQGRKVRASKPGKTLFDGEWIEGQQQCPTYIRPHSKIVLREAVRSDAEFLSRSNIMDYSLLLGIDPEKKQLNCGLVDTIGSYTFAKTLEYKAKQGLSSGKEVTVIPPAEYQERFVNALEGYFTPCPDKWTKPLDSKKIVSDARSLPSVL